MSEFKMPPGLSVLEREVFEVAAQVPMPWEWIEHELPPPDFLSESPIDLSVQTALRLPEVIGLHGKPGVGKDTVAWLAAYGLAAVGVRARVIGTSEPVIAEANAYLARYERRVGHANKSWPPFRLLLQTLGEVRRREDPRYWNKAHIANIRQIQAEEVKKGYGIPVIFLTGIRTMSDMELVCGEPLACPVVRVYREGNPYQADHWIERQLDHVPDYEFSVVIHNRRENDFEDLKAQVRAMCITLADHWPNPRPLR